MNEIETTKPTPVPSDAELLAIGYYCGSCPACGARELLHPASLGMCPSCLADRQEEAEEREVADGVCPACGSGRLPEDYEYGSRARGCRCPVAVD